MKFLLVVLSLFAAGCSKSDANAPATEQKSEISEQPLRAAGEPGRAAAPNANATPPSAAAPIVADATPDGTQPAAPAHSEKTEGDKAAQEARLDRLLSERLEGGMDFTFAQFANMFLVKSRLSLRDGIGLMTSDRDVAEHPLQSPFPETYEPTLREFLDAIALQTKTSWKRDYSGRYVKSEVPVPEKNQPAIFEFVPTKRAKPYEVTLPADWKSEDHGNWLMTIPPDFPVGLDVYEMGTYSTDNLAKRAALLKQIPLDVSLQWMGRTKEKVDAAELKPAKVGPYDALYYETMVPSPLGEELKWRQWVFMVDNRCYFIVSTILPKLDSKIFPGVEKILASFREKQKPAETAEP